MAQNTGQFGPSAILGANGQPGVSTNVLVTNGGSGATGPTATLYTSTTRGTTLSNPTSTDSLGNLTFYADSGPTYDLTYTIGGVQTTISNVGTEMPDPPAYGKPVAQFTLTAGTQAATGAFTIGAPGFYDVEITCVVAGTGAEAINPSISLYINGNPFGAPVSGYVAASKNLTLCYPTTLWLDAGDVLTVNCIADSTYNTEFFVENANTTIASGSDGDTLPQSTIDVASSTEFAFSQWAYVEDTEGLEVIALTGTGSGTLTGCSRGTGTLATGNLVSTGFGGVIQATWLHG